MSEVAGKLVLIIEDNEKNLKLARDLLRVKGYRTLEAGSAEEGIPLAVAQRPDLVLMDIQLPGMDGEAAIRRLRADPTTASLPAIAVTSFAMKGERERLLAAGFDAYLAKPIDIHEFLRQVQAHCERGQREA